MNAVIEQPPLGFTARLTQKANLKHTRYGWLRLTPAYSVHLVADILDEFTVKKLNLVTFTQKVKVKTEGQILNVTI